MKHSSMLWMIVVASLFWLPACALLGIGGPEPERHQVALFEVSAKLVEYQKVNSDWMDPLTQKATAVDFPVFTIENAEEVDQTIVETVEAANTFNQHTAQIKSTLVVSRSLWHYINGKVADIGDTNLGWLTSSCDAVTEARDLIRSIPVQCDQLLVSGGILKDKIEHAVEICPVKEWAQLCQTIDFVKDSVTSSVGTLEESVEIAPGLLAELADTLKVLSGLRTADQVSCR